MFLVVDQKRSFPILAKVMISAYYYDAPTAYCPD